MAAIDRIMPEISGSLMANRNPVDLRTTREMMTTGRRKSIRRFRWSIEKFYRHFILFRYVQEQLASRRIRIVKRT
jgi:hypothetical protein